MHVPGDGDRSQDKRELEKRVLMAQTEPSSGQRERLLREYRPYIQKIASRICKRSVTMQDDEFSIALNGFNEAISRYEQNQPSSFLSFAYMVVQRRLVDHYRREKKHQNQLPLVPAGARENEPTHPEVVAQSFDHYREQELSEVRRSEVAQFAQLLRRYDITMTDLVKTSPKHRDTRENMLALAQIIVNEKDLLKQFLHGKKITKEFAERVGCHRRTLRRHRTYLIALALVLVEDLPMMREYLGFSYEKKGVELVQKGIVMEVGPQYWVVMTPEGEFLKVPTDERSVEPGDEICFTLKKERLALFKKRRSWIASGLAVALVTLFLLIPVIGPSQAQADSYVYLDLNPSLELGLDKSGKVIQVRPLNETGKKLVKGLDWKGFEVDSFVVTVLSKARADGYIRPQEGIIVSQTSSERNHVPQTQRTLQSIKQSVERDPELNQEELKVFTLLLPDLLRKRAEEMGISPAKYALWMLSKRDGQPIGSDELMALSTSDLMKRIDISPILRNPPSKDEWEDWIEEDDKLKEKGSENPDSKDEKEKDQSSQDPQKSKDGQDSSKDSSNRDNPSSEKPKGKDQKDHPDNPSGSDPSDPDRSDEKPGEGHQDSPDSDPAGDQGKEPDEAESDHSKTTHD